MREIVKTHSILGTRIRQRMAGTAERICAIFTWKPCLAIRSDEFECQGQKSNVKVTTYQGQKTHCAVTTPPWYGRNGMPSLQIMLCKQHTRWFDCCTGVTSPACVRWIWRTTAGLCHAFLVVEILSLFMNGDIDVGWYNCHARYMLRPYVCLSQVCILSK